MKITAALVLLLIISCQLKTRAGFEIKDDNVVIDVSDVNTLRDAYLKIEPHLIKAKENLGVYLISETYPLGGPKEHARRMITILTKLNRLAAEGKVGNLGLKIGTRSITIEDQTTKPNIFGNFSLNWQESSANLEKLFAEMSDIKSYWQQAQKKFDDLQLETGIRFNWRLKIYDNAKISPAQAVSIAENISYLTKRYLINADLAVIHTYPWEQRLANGVNIDDLNDLEKIQATFKAVQQVNQVADVIKVQRTTNQLFIEAKRHIGTEVINEGGSLHVEDHQLVQQTLKKLIKLDQARIKQGVFGDLAINNELESALTLGKVVYIKPETPDEKIIELLNQRPDELSYHALHNKLIRRRAEVGAKYRFGQFDLAFGNDRYHTFEQELALLDLIEKLITEGFRLQTPTQVMWVIDPAEAGKRVRYFDKEKLTLLVSTNASRQEILKFMTKVR